MHENGASCNLILFEDKKFNKKLQIMVDCGLNQKMEQSRFKHFQRKIQKTRLVLLSESSLEYSGGLPLLLNQNNMKCDILATSPMVDYSFRNFMDQYINLSQAFMHIGDQQEDEFERVLGEVEDIYSRIHRLNFGQIQEFSYCDGLYNVQVTPIRSGYSIGSCAWKICVNMTNIIYISSYGMYKEAHLDPIAIDKLLMKNLHQQHSILNKSQYDLLLIENLYQRQDNSVKKTISDALDHVTKTKSSHTKLIISFYPNERILEGVMVLEQLSHQTQFRCELYSNYIDIIEKARGQTDFLGSEFLNWKFQEQLYQTPLDPDHLKQQFLDIRKDDSPIQSKVVLTTYNSLFMGPLSNKFKPLLENSHTILLIFGSPKSLLYENLKFLKEGF